MDNLILFTATIIVFGGMAYTVMDMSKHFDDKKAHH